jgi:hypothetical protein
VWCECTCLRACVTVANIQVKTEDMMSLNKYDLFFLSHLDIAEILCKYVCKM